MGLFNLFKKNGDNNKEPNPEDTMLTLNERQKPTLKSDTKPPSLGTAPPAQTQQAAPEVMLTPDPQVNEGQKTVYNFAEEPAPEPEQFARENLSTKSLEKNINSMPNVKKLVIPSNNEAMEQKVEPTDTVFAERVKLKQVDLAGGEKEEENELTPSTNFIPGEFIDLPISLLIEHIDSTYLSSNATTLFDNSAKIRFTKDEVLSIMAQGAFAVVGSALFARFPAGVASEKGKTTSDVLEFPLDKILTLVPPDWFALQGQDNSLTESLGNMSNPFQDLEAPVPEANPQEEPSPAPETKSSSNSLFDNDDEVSVEVTEDPEETTLDSMATLDQSAPPVIEEEADPLETMVQSSPPQTPEVQDHSSLETMIQEKPPEVPAPAAESGPAPETNDTTLVVPVETIRAALNQEIFSNLPQNTYLQIPRDRVLSSLAEGVFRLTAQEIDTFAGTSSINPANANSPVEVDLGLIMGLIPPEWFAIQGQDNTQNEILTNMRDVFDDSTFEEAAKELEEAEEEKQPDSTGEGSEEEQAVVVEDEAEEVSIEEEEEEAGDSLITGGIFGKMNSLFDDDDEEEEEVSIEEEEEKAEITPPVIEEETQQEPSIAPPVIEEEEEKAEITPPVIEEETQQEPSIAPPVIEEEIETRQESNDEQTKLALPPLNKPISVTPPSLVEDKEEEAVPVDSLQTITINRSDDAIFDDGRVAREQEKELERQVEKVADQISQEETVAQLPTETDSESPDDETKKVKNAGQVTYRPIADEAPELTDKSELRPSTAPNGIDINRSNLKDLCRLHSAGEKLAQTLIEYREANGDFKSINELINVPGVGTSVYRSLTGLRPSADLVGAERRINKVVGLSTDTDFHLGKIIKEAQTKFGFKSLILSDKDGFEICSSGDKSLLESNSELLAATTPQLFKKTKHFLKQSNLPHPEIFTFYLEDTPVTFGIADEVFMVMVHSSKWPEPKHMKQCRELINELAWFCSYRAIV